METIELFDPSLFQAQRADHSINPARHLLRLLLPQTGFEIHGQQSASRAQVECYIGTKFADEYGAELYHFLPRLLTMQCRGRLSAAVGVNAAGNGSLFIEQYMDQSIEQILSEDLGRAIARDEVVEIGNLVASHRGASQLLFVVLASALYHAGYRWVVFTATRQVARIFAKLHCATIDLGAADPQRLGSAIERWGNYYHAEPHVLAVDLAVAIECGRDNLAQNVVLRLYDKCAKQLSAQL